MSLLEKLQNSRNALGWAFMLPAAVLLLGLLAYPLGLGTWLGFTDAKIGRPGEWVGLENTVINLMALFAKQGDRDALLDVLRAISTEEVNLREDDGLGQKVTVKQGVHVKGTGSVPNPASLAPFRTFPEVAHQPESFFIVRLKDGGNQVYVLLKPADGGAWSLEAVESIAEVLKGYLAEVPSAPEVIF